jgi:DNA polymerase-3 subunit delta
MKRITEDIKNRTFKTVYLLFGTERYLINTYAARLKSAVIPEDDAINFNGFEGKDTDWNEVISLGETMPFFADRRLITIDGSGLFKTSGEASAKMAGWVKDIPETTTLIFTENEVDKRNALYKAVAENGLAVEMNGPTENDLKTFIGSRLKKNDLKITENDAQYLLETVGSDMMNLVNEMEKLIGYTLGRDVVTREDIDTVCVRQISGRIFDLTDGIAEKNREKAMHAYAQMIALRERPAGILYRVTSHFNSLLQTKDLVSNGKNARDVASVLKIKQYPADKYYRQAKRFSKEALAKAVSMGIEYETAFKQGNMDEALAVEMYMVNLLQ